MFIHHTQPRVGVTNIIFFVGFCKYHSTNYLLNIAFIFDLSNLDVIERKNKFTIA